MPKLALILIALILLSNGTSFAQKLESSICALEQVPVKYITGIENKIDRYSSRITSKTEKTLTRLSRWENKIHSILQQANPAAAERLFSNSQLTFTTMLQKFKDGEAISSQYQAQYDEYRDRLITNVKYLQVQKESINSKIIRPLELAKKKIESLNEKEDRLAAIQQLIKERKRQLINGSFQYIGKSKYLAKINKDSWYYVESLKNYKEIFSDESKAEALAKRVLNQIPAFKQFVQKYGILASLFGTNSMDMSGTGASLIGLQTRDNVFSLIQDRLSSGGPNAIQEMQQSIQSAQSEINNLKSQFQSGSSSSLADMPDFRPNMEKTRTFKQRLEFGSDFQFGKSNYLLPTSANVAIKIGYKLNSKSIAGLGASYNLGMGTIQHISFSNQGVSIRSFLDWKLKKQFYLSGGMEMNYLAALQGYSIPQSNLVLEKWQKAALLGISKKSSIKTKWFKGTQIQLFYDFLSQQHIPVSQPVVFRMGYYF